MATVGLPAADWENDPVSWLKKFKSWGIFLYSIFVAIAGPWHQRGGFFRVAPASSINLDRFVVRALKNRALILRGPTEATLFIREDTSNTTAVL
jgi:hypothetical protein